MWRAVNEAKLQGRGLSVRFLGVVWSGKTKVIPEAVIDKIQVYPTPSTVKQLQMFWRLLGCWRVFVPHLAEAIHPLYALVKQGMSWDGTLTLKQALQRVNTSLNMLRPCMLWVLLPCELDVRGTQEGFGRGLWQHSEWLCQPLGFWSQPWKGAEVWYSLIENNWRRCMLPRRSRKR